MLSLLAPRSRSLIIILIHLLNSIYTEAADRKQDVQANKLVVITAADELNAESFIRFNRSIQTNGLDLTVLTLSDRNSKAQQIDLYRKTLLNYRNNEDTLVMLIDDCYGTIINANEKEILHRFKSLGRRAHVLFAADRKCWPDPSLESQYPDLPSHASDGPRYVNSRIVIGFAPSLWDLLNLSNEIEQSSGGGGDGDEGSVSAQMYYTRAFLNPDVRNKLQLEIDYKAELVQNLDSSERVELEFDSNGVKLKNLAHQTEPLVVYGDQMSKIVLNSLGNYLAKAWTLEAGCRYCNVTLKLPDSEDKTPLPSVLIGIFIEEPTPFLSHFFRSILQLKYPRRRLHLFVHNSIPYHEQHLKQFKLDIGSHYASTRFIHASSNESAGGSISEWEARKSALEQCESLDCRYYLSLDSTARLDMPETLRILIEANKTVIAPLLSRPTKLWSNFWGSLTADGFYARSHDYVSLVRRDRIGIWNVPLLADAYLIEGGFIRKSLRETKSHHSEPLTQFAGKLVTRPGLLFSHELRATGVDQFLLNTHEFGHLVDPSSFNASLKNPDFYQLQDNILDWERVYLHENYSLVVDNNDTKLEQPCPDVYWFPLVSDLFCKHLIEIMEHHGHWSGGKNEDPRIEGGYESVPTRDIHMRQVGLHEMWLDFLRDYVMPVQLREYIGYEHDPPRADLAFVVRYHPSEQASLRPHHDSSTYTLNIALNEPGLDYEGGGCKFVRYNCSVVESRKGWALIHPGRLTHYHEGLPVTNGTRYIMVTFVDP